MVHILRGLVVVAFVGCGPAGGGSQRDGTGSSDAGSDVGSSSTALEGLDSTGTDQSPVCTPGETRCDGETGLELCDQSGDAWTSEPCPIGTACQDDQCAGPGDGLPDLGTSGCEFIADGPATVELIFIEPGWLGLDQVVVQSAVLGVGEAVAWSLGSDDVGETSSVRPGGMFRVHSDRPVVAYQQGPDAIVTGNDSPGPAHLL